MQTYLFLQGDLLRERLPSGLRLNALDINNESFSVDMFNATFVPERLGRGSQPFESIFRPERHCFLTADLAHLCNGKDLHAFHANPDYGLVSRFSFFLPADAYQHHIWMIIKLVAFVAGD